MIASQSNRPVAPCPIIRLQHPRYVKPDSLPRQTTPRSFIAVEMVFLGTSLPNFTLLATPRKVDMITLHFSIITTVPHSYCSVSISFSGMTTNTPP